MGLFSKPQSEFERLVSELRAAQKKQQELTRQRHALKGEATRVQQQIDDLQQKLKSESRAVSREIGTSLKVSGIVSGEVFGDIKPKQ